jgi:hypothetical protein
MHLDRSFRRARTSRLVGILVAGAVGLVLSHDIALAATEQKQCQIASGSLGRLSVVYTAISHGQEVTKQFDADLELHPSGQYKEGQPVTFVVRGVEVGKRRLKLDRNGDLEADLQLTTEAKRGPKVWPEAFPNIRPGTRVAAQIRGVTVLQCSFL